MAAENVETTWSLDLQVLEDLERVGKGFTKVADLEEAAKKKDPFKTAAQGAGNYNSKLLQGTRIYAQVTSSAKSYESEIQRLNTVQQELNRRQKEFTAAGKYTQLKKELAAVTTQLEKLNAEQKKLDTGRDRKGRFTPGAGPAPTGGLGGQIGGVGKNLLGQLGGLAGGLFAVDKAFDLLVKGPAEFGRSLSQLSAITGATGKDLEFLEQQAIQFEKDTGKSAQSMLTAFQVVGSIKPELLANKDLLAQTTKEVLALQDAAGNISLDEAAESLLGALNQFGAGAEEASRFVNVLAAGAKAGSSEIVDTSQAFKTAGTALSAANLTFEESNALVQTLAGVMIKGGEAGTALRNVVLKLETATDKNLRPSVVGLDKALENASIKYNTTTKLSKEFGVENIVAARRILDTRKEIAKLTEALTGTEVAYEQQRINQGNLATDLDKLGTSFTGFFRNLGRDQDSFLRLAVQSFTSFINQIGDKSSDLRNLLNLIYNPDKVGAFREFQQDRTGRAAAEAKKVQNEGIRNQAAAEIPSAIRQQTQDLIRQGTTKNEAEIQAAQAVLAVEVANLTKARKFYQDTVDEFRKATTEEDKTRLTNDGKLNATAIKAAKFRVETAEKALSGIQKRSAGQAQALESALQDEADKKADKDKKTGDKAEKLREKQQAKAVDLQEKLNAELQQLENEYGKERLESLGKDSSAYLQEKARIDVQLIEQEQQTFVKLKQLNAGAQAGKFDKNGDPIADQAVELSSGELGLFERRKSAVMTRLQLELDGFYREHIDKEQKHQDQVNELIGSEYDQQVERVRQKYADVLKLVEKGSNDEIRLNKAKEAELKRLELGRQLEKVGKANEVAQSNAELRLLQAQINGRYDQEQKAQVRLLQVEQKGLQDRLSLLLEFGDETTQEEAQIVANRIDAITAQMDQLSRAPGARNVWDAFGLGNGAQELIRSLQPVADAFQNLADINLQYGQQRIDLIDQEIDAKKRQIDAETALNKEGVANNLSLRERELVQLKTQRTKALQEQRQAQRLANAQETATQIAGMITASVNLLKTSTILGPIAGPIIAKIAIASMFGLYAASKIKAAQLAKAQDQQNFREGGWLDGPSHERGGMRVEGTNMVLEGKEHVTKARRANRFAHILDAINEGPAKPMPWADLRKLAQERGISLADSQGIASPQVLQALVVSKQEAYTGSSPNPPVDPEVLGLLTDILSEARLGNQTSQYVYKNKHVKRVGHKTTITLLDA